RAFPGTGVPACALPFFLPRAAPGGATVGRRRHADGGELPAGVRRRAPRRSLLGDARPLGRAGALRSRSAGGRRLRPGPGGVPRAVPPAERELAPVARGERPAGARRRVRGPGVVRTGGRSPPPGAGGLEERPLRSPPALPPGPRGRGPGGRALPDG